jgi:hypothetical protein
LAVMAMYRFPSASISFSTIDWPALLKFVASAMELAAKSASPAFRVPVANQLRGAAVGKVPGLMPPEWIFIPALRIPVSHGTSISRKRPDRPDLAVVVIGHVATRRGLDHVIEGISLEDLIAADFAWRPGWEYHLDA